MGRSRPLIGADTSAFQRAAEARAAEERPLEDQEPEDGNEGRYQHRGFIPKGCNLIAVGERSDTHVLYVAAMPLFLAESLRLSDRLLFDPRLCLIHRG